jgi:hypothetical protein
MRQSLGTAVFAGMLGVTVFGLLFTPAFYTFIRKQRHKAAPLPGATPVASDTDLTTISGDRRPS